MSLYKTLTQELGNIVEEHVSIELSEDEKTARIKVYKSLAALDLMRAFQSWLKDQAISTPSREELIRQLDRERRLGL